MKHQGVKLDVRRIAKILGGSCGSEGAGMVTYKIPFEDGKLMITMGRFRSNPSVFAKRIIQEEEIYNVCLCDVRGVFYVEKENRVIFKGFKPQGRVRSSLSISANGHIAMEV